MDEEIVYYNITCFPLPRSHAFVRDNKKTPGGISRVQLNPVPWITKPNNHIPALKHRPFYPGMPRYPFKLFDILLFVIGGRRRGREGEGVKFSPSF